MMSDDEAMTRLKAHRYDAQQGACVRCGAWFDEILDKYPECSGLDVTKMRAEQIARFHQRNRILARLADG